MLAAFLKVNSFFTLLKLWQLSPGKLLPKAGNLIGLGNEHQTLKEKQKR